MPEQLAHMIDEDWDEAAIAIRCINAATGERRKIEKRLHAGLFQEVFVAKHLFELIRSLDNKIRRI